MRLHIQTGMITHGAHTVYTHVCVLMVANILSSEQLYPSLTFCYGQMHKLSILGHGWCLGRGYGSWMTKYGDLRAVKSDIYRWKYHQQHVLDAQRLLTDTIPLVCCPFPANQYWFWGYGSWHSKKTASLESKKPLLKPKHVVLFTLMRLEMKWRSVPSQLQERVHQRSDCVCLHQRLNSSFEMSL